MTSGPKKLLPETIGAASPASLIECPDSILEAPERAVLAFDMAWVQWRSDFRRTIAASGILRRPWRSVFEADMMFSIVSHQWLIGRPITLKELATYFEQFATAATVSRHIDDMEDAGMLARAVDANDRRRFFLMPTERLEVIGRAFLQARVRTLRDHGFVWAGDAAIDPKTAIDPA
ncbi:MarR family transcriptional regulator [Afipia massiliensis]|uniref:MarR family transcriptional regulator n=1 Tax=Afipia massiliensis TaxID=211460 RepID=A0A4U6BTK8_9BRAD|nr:MarR family transcriptional regulator [Afipia massiliensis]TKT72144.1 MarR family transcriptional regulator [Afipia massiliensis]